MQLRCSRLPLLTKCPGSLWLPQDTDESEELAKANEWGRLVHRWKETGEISGAPKRVCTAFRTAIRASGIDRLCYWPRGGTHERSVAIKLDGSRQVVNRLGPEDLEAYSAAVGWLIGTPDFYWTLIDGELWVDDLKTGKWYDDPENPGTNRFPQDPRSTQLRAYALAIAALTGYSGPTTVSITHWPRLPVARRHALPVRYSTRYTQSELESFWGTLEKLWQNYTAGLGTVYPGEHCRFCPSRNYCIEAEPIPVYDWREHVVS